MDKILRSIKLRNMANSGDEETTYPLRAAARVTGLSPDLLRAWEGRYGVVEPVRTAGGTRRYRAADLERLRLVKAAVDAGHRIGVVAKMDPVELANASSAAEAPPVAGLGPILSALERLDAEETHRLMSIQFSALGPVRFAREVAIPLVCEIGERWAAGKLGIASEHLATSVLRSMLGSALTPNTASRFGPTIVFATPIGERHELGLQSAALTAMGAGANPLYLGTELHVEDLLGAVATTAAAVLALSLVTIAEDEASSAVASLRHGLSGETRLWIGGPRASEVAWIHGVECIGSLDDLEKRVELLSFERPQAR